MFTFDLVTCITVAEVNKNVPSNVKLTGVKKFMTDFDKCLSINDQVAGAELVGKYCRVLFDIPRPIPYTSLNNETIMLDRKYAERRNLYRIGLHYGCKNDNR